MARNNLFNKNDQQGTLVPGSYYNAESLIDGGVTVPDDGDPRRNMETLPDDSGIETARINFERRENSETIPSFRARKADPTMIEDELETRQVPEQGKNLRNRRVVGWMVGIRGICRGVDYRLHEGKNYIGRDERCEVNVNDIKVSAGNVAQVVFDPRSKRFFSSDCDGTATICYQNGEPLLGRTELKRYDKIELGDSELLFLPLCGEEFTWEETEKKED